MGAIKSNHYTQNEQALFLTARAFAHPARIRIMKFLQSGNALRNIDLCEKLNLTKGAIKGHIDMLKDADLVHVDYSIHYYKISLNQRGKFRADSILELESETNF